MIENSEERLTPPKGSSKLGSTIKRKREYSPSKRFEESPEQTEKLADLQMKETLLAEQAILLQDKERDIVAREKLLNSKE